MKHFFLLLASGNSVISYFLINHERPRFMAYGDFAAATNGERGMVHICNLDLKRVIAKIPFPENINHVTGSFYSPKTQTVISVVNRRTYKFYQLYGREI